MDKGTKRMKPSKVKWQLEDYFGENLLENEPLSKHTSFRIGGVADYFLIANTPDKLIGGINRAKKLGLGYFVLGGGSNILVGDNGFRGLVIKNECKEYFCEDEYITAQSGALLNDIVDLSAEHSLSGLEFAAGIWGTMGGAICGNAGAFGGSISELLGKAVVYDIKGDISIVDKDYFHFGYRRSALKESKELLLSVTLKLRKGNRSEIKGLIDRHRSIRTERHPIDIPSAGSFFKNFKNPAVSGMKTAAGWYLEQIGARDFRVGDAGVFKKHSNMFVNHGNAKASDVIRLAAELKRRVLDKFGLNLQMEVMPVGDFGEYTELLKFIRL